MAKSPVDLDSLESEVDECEEEEEEQNEVWGDWNSDEEEPDAGLLCLFCDSRYVCGESLFDHCKSNHYFDFHALRRDLGLDFYSSFKLINYIRSQVAEQKCWWCGLKFHNKNEFENHVHAIDGVNNDGKLPWEHDVYLKPFMVDDALLHSFAVDEDDEDNDVSIDKDELLKELMEKGALNDISIAGESMKQTGSFGLDVCDETEKQEASARDNSEHDNGKAMPNGIAAEDHRLLNQKRKDEHLRVSFSNVAEREIKNVNDDYFGAYGSFGIHRVMLSDKVRMDAYRGALLNNPSLMNQAIVMDVGCGTGILSLFAAQAGASKVLAIEASSKMATVTTQIVKDNSLQIQGSHKNEGRKSTGVITVVQCMVEELNNVFQLEPQSVDVLVSEWMGYCLLYESMLSSVLYARDHWLKPGGAILPDTATIFAAGFGRGGTSLLFWENVCGFNMSCIGKEVVEDAAQVPIIDLVESRDIMTESVIVQAFDLTTMKPDNMDFTASFELKLKPDPPSDDIDAKPELSWCYGLVLWFETGFTSRFCKERPTVLSTSPYSPGTHWSQTILTFETPVAMTSAKVDTALATSATTGTADNPASKIRCRISLVRSSAHRCIEISMEIVGISLDGRKHRYPVQVFKL